MMEKPILFSGPMVRAILDGRKTQTRRILSLYTLEPDERMVIKRMQDKTYAVCQGLSCLCPYGNVGDRLWVRETWAMASKASDLAKIYYKASEQASHTEFHEMIPIEKCGKIQPSWPKWKPSIHMPRSFSRIQLEITNIQVERLQDISEADALAEGIGSPITRDCKVPGFQKLWSEINGPESWAGNPWVWVIKFWKMP